MGFKIANRTIFPNGQTRKPFSLIENAWTFDPISSPSVSLANSTDDGPEEVAATLHQSIEFTFHSGAPTLVLKVTRGSQEVRFERRRR
jgi:ABC-type uncharacterized transport system substrate-binding protein